MAASPRRAQIFGGPRSPGPTLGPELQNVRNVEEEELLSALEELAQKTEVLPVSEWPLFGMCVARVSTLSLSSSRPAR